MRNYTYVICVFTFFVQNPKKHDFLKLFLSCCTRFLEHCNPRCAQGVAAHREEKVKYFPGPMMFGAAIAPKIEGCSLLHVRNRRWCACNSTYYKSDIYDATSRSQSSVVQLTKDGRMFQ